MENYHFIDSNGGLVTDNEDLTKAGLMGVFNDIENELNSLHGITNQSERYKVGPLYRYEGGISITGGPEQLSFKEDKQMRFVTRHDDIGHAYNRSKYDELIFKKNWDDSCWLCPRRVSSDIEYFKFRTNGKKHHWTYREACVVQSCFGKVGFRFEPVPEEGWRKEK